MIEEDDGKKCDYFNSFIKCAINDLNKKGFYYVYHKEQIDEIEKRLNKKLDIVKKDFMYVISIKK